MSNYEQYLICQERSHESNGNLFSNGTTVYYTCKHCGVRWHTETKVIEENIPDKEENT